MSGEVGLLQVSVLCAPLRAKWNERFVCQPLIEQLSRSTHGKPQRAQSDGWEHVLLELFLEGSPRRIHNTTSDDDWIDFELHGVLCAVSF